VGKAPRVHFLTTYFEYLLDSGIRTENDYLGDASRFLRYLADRATAEDIDRFISTRTTNPAYRRRLKARLRKFYQFASEQLDFTHNPAL